MTDLFYMGGPLFMGLLTLLLIASVTTSILVFTKKVPAISPSLIKDIGLLAFIVGLLGQLIGLFDAFSAIEQMGSVSPAMLAGGLKVSMITTVYGLFILIISLILHLSIHFLNKSKELN